MQRIHRRSLLAAAAGGCAVSLAACSGQDEEGDKAVAGLGLGGVEVANSGRGQIDWLGQAADPSGWPLLDSYRRPDGAWRTIEKRRGQYDWTLLDQAMQQARTRGGRLLFRIMPWYAPGQAAEAPSWVPTRTIRPADGSESFTCPDWSSTGYIHAWIDLVRAMGSHADRDRRLRAVDLSGYGAWGEHYWEEENWGPRMSATAFRPIVEATRAAFPNTWVIGPAMEPGFSTTAKVYAKGGKWGTRFDFLGGMELSYDDVSAYRDLWKSGPIVTEWGSSDNVTMARGLQTVKDLHVSVLSSGNKPIKYASLNGAEQAAFTQANLIAGYRLSLDGFTAPASWVAGQQIRVTPTWTNHGVAPTYDVWQLELLAGTSVIPLGGDLRTLLPGTRTMTHTLAAPDPGVPLSVRVQDPTGMLVRCDWPRRTARPMEAIQSGEGTVRNLETGCHPVR